MIEEQEVRHRGRRRTPEEIEQIVSEFESGRLTQIEFCQRQGLAPSTLGRYLRRLRPSSEAISDGLVAVELAVKKFDKVHAGGCGLGVVVAGGRRIVVASNCHISYPPSALTGLATCAEKVVHPVTFEGNRITT